MSSSTAAPNYVNVFILILIILASTVYSIPIATVRRLRSQHNILTANLCLGLIFLLVYWIVFCLMSEHASEVFYTSPTCTIFLYIQYMLTGQAICAFTITSLNRYFYIVRPESRYLNSKRWLRFTVCGQWLLGVILPLPVFARNLPVRELTSEQCSKSTRDSRWRAFQ